MPVAIVTSYTERRRRIRGVTRRAPSSALILEGRRGGLSDAELARHLLPQHVGRRPAPRSGSRARCADRALHLTGLRGIVSSRQKYHAPLVHTVCSVERAGWPGRPDVWQMDDGEGDAACAI